MKPENKFRTWFIDKAKDYMAQHYPGVRVLFHKHADMATSGVPDMDVSIAGITLWEEFKYLPACVKGRKLDVSSLQRDYLEELTQGGVGAGVLVGLTLGPRKGYDVALYYQTIPEVALRSDFGPYTHAVEQLVALAKHRASEAHRVLSTVDPYRAGGVLRLPVLAARRDADRVNDVGC